VLGGRRGNLEGEKRTNLSCKENGNSRGAEGRGEGGKVQWPKKSQQQEEKREGKKTVRAKNRVREASLQKGKFRAGGNPGLPSPMGRKLEKLLYPS